MSVAQDAGKATGLSTAQHPLAAGRAGEGTSSGRRRGALPKNRKPLGRCPTTIG
jgi:hypothetical protein